MILLSAKNIKKSYTEKPLLTDINLHINEGDKIGLVGVNGSGKSTLLKIIAGAIEHEGGEITTSNNLMISYLPQNPDYNPELTVLEQMLEYTNGDKNRHEIPEYICRSYLQKVGMSDYDALMKTQSGGQRKRVALAGVMAREGNLLILDEPTNHMDNDIIEWMEEQLIDYKGAVLMITHDRYFLERVTDHICEIEKGRLVTYEGNYDKYLTMKAERLQMAMASERKRAAIYKKELRWIRWTAPARSTKARGRIQRFEQLEASKETFDNPELQIGTVTSRLGRKIIELDSVTKAYGDRTLISDFSYTILRNDRIGIIGPNGCGKTTLMKMIMGEVEPDSGTIEIGDTVKIGYFSQESEHLDPDKRVIKFIEEISNSVRTSEGTFSASQMLERFLFPSHMHSVMIGRLSGGEKRRLYLLSILMQAPNVLIFDEPTNDLDIDTLTILEDYLDDFQGAVIIVSHDRYFLDRLVIRTFAFEGDGYVGHYTGGYSKYMNEKEEREAQAKQAKGKRRQDQQTWNQQANGRHAQDQQAWNQQANGRHAQGQQAKTTASPNRQSPSSSSADCQSPAAGNHSSASADCQSPAAGNYSSARQRSNNRDASRPVKLRFTYKEQKEYDSIEDDITNLEDRIAEVEGEIGKCSTDYIKLSELSAQKTALEEELLEKMDRWEYLSDLAERIANQ